MHLSVSASAPRELLGEGDKPESNSQLPVFSKLPDEFPLALNFEADCPAALSLRGANVVRKGEKGGRDRFR